jgi:ABC-type transporter Mla maintaining outer membrane lipid asymmetry ATPase subunit MlaF
MVMLDKGKVLFVGTPDEIRACDIPRVRQFLEREPDEESQDVEQYLKNLTR